MAIFTEIIPTQNFDIVASKIAEILTAEIANQQTLQGFQDEVNVFLERIEPFAKEEDVMVSVAFRESIPEGHTQKDSQGYNMYFIDLFVSGYGTPGTPPSIVTKNKLFRYLGLIRYILSSGKIPTLGLPRGFIGGKYIKKITLDTDYSNFGNHSNYDWAYIRFARIMYLVRVQESQLLSLGVPLQENNTTILYENTTKGVKLKFNN